MQNNSTTENVLEALYQATGKRPTRSSPGYWSARCPAHDDRKASLTVWEGDHRIVLSCYRDCSEEEILKVSELFSSDLSFTPDSVRPSLSIKSVRGKSSSREVEEELQTEEHDSESERIFDSLQPWIEGQDEELRDGWRQLQREWGQFLKLVRGGIRGSETDLASAVFFAGEVAAKAHKTWKAQASLTTYSSERILEAVRAEVRGQSYEQEPERLDEEPVVPVAPHELVGAPIEQAPHLCWSCHLDISHKRSDARFCGDTHSKRYRRQEAKAKAELETMVTRIDPLAAHRDDRGHYAHRDAV